MGLMRRIVHLVELVHSLPPESPERRKAFEELERLSRNLNQRRVKREPVQVKRQGTA